MLALFIIGLVVGLYLGFRLGKGLGPHIILSKLIRRIK